MRRTILAAVVAVALSTTGAAHAFERIPEPAPLDEMVANRLLKAVTVTDEITALKILPVIEDQAKEVRADWVRSYELQQERIAAAKAAEAAAQAQLHYNARTPAEVAAPVEYSGDLRSLICSYPWDCSIALGVSSCESGMSTTAGTPGNYYGLFQVDYETSSDPVIQVRHAWEKYESAGGWYPWGYPDGAFGCYWG